MSKAVVKTRMVKKHIHIDSEIYKKLCIIATLRYGSPTRKVFLVINEALKEYVDRNLPK